MLQPYYRAAVIVFIVLFTISNYTTAQVRLDADLLNSNVGSYSNSIVRSPVGNCLPPENVLDNGTQLHSIPAQSWLWGGAYTFISRGLPNCKISSQGTGNMLVDGNGSATVKVQWWCHSNTQYDCYDPDCPTWFATDTSLVNSTILLRITGVPDGTPVQVSYYWKHYSSIANEPEAGNEDYAEIQNASVNLFNQAGFGNSMNLSGSAKFAQKRTGDSVQTVNMVAGDSLEIKVAAKTLAHIEPPAKFPNDPKEDDASADFYGFVVIEVSTSGSVVSLYDSCDADLLLYSVDIGSDKEFSDPMPEGDENLDPGDLYVKGGTSPAPYFDDSLLFNMDPNPSPGNPAGTCFPGPMQAWQQVLNFDLDGADRIDYDLYSNLANYGLGKPSIAAYHSDCIFSPQYMLFSADEDRGIDLSSAANCNVPSSFAPSDSVYLRGTPFGRDEVMAATLSNYPGTSFYLGSASPYLDEEAVSPLLAPDPLSYFPPDSNDDVDALDMLSANASCGYQYFSVDHEAHYLHHGDTLRGGFIYQYIQPDSLVPVIVPLIHLGLSDDADIDAFEFAWLYDSSQQRYGLGLVFSVSAMDPFAAKDYTGGLDPAALYGSFLNGSYFEVMPPVGAAMNIDALTFTCKPVNAYGSVYVPYDTLSTGMINRENDILALRLYPNPNTGNFNLEFSLKQAAKIRVNVQDLNGRKVWQNEPIQLLSGFQNLNIPLGHISNGLYVVEVIAQSREGISTYKKKVTVMK